ncbi:MAG: hypothetical protein A2Z18_07030 [Armatimonadetes bacterium RBG_16_58_9]|nr:MAG: hypothetical protein A2Z18_07030 [Armatimonadetes bacterium RBG_16_58_9]
MAVTFGGYVGVTDFQGNYAIQLPVGVTVKQLYPELGFYRFSIGPSGTGDTPPPPPPNVVVYPYPGGVEHLPDSIMGPLAVWNGDSTDMLTILITESAPPGPP